MGRLRANIYEVQANLFITCSNTFKYKTIKNSKHNFELEQRSSFTVFSLACRQAGMTG